ncbi:MAG: J domain-containing protein [Rhizobiaceae bacterium]
MARNPWSVLGIPRTSDERAIKSAYAKKLKVTRPEDDQAAFQELVEARDAAVSIARNASQRAQRAPRKKARTVANDRVVVEVQRPPIAPVQPLPNLVKAPWGAQALPVENEAQEVSRNDVIDAAISSFLEASASPEQFDTAMSAIDELLDGHINAKAALEPALLRSVVDWLAEQDTAVREKTIAKAGAQTYNLQKSVVTRLDAAYGWSEDIKRLSTLVPFANELTDQLLYLRHRYRPESDKAAKSPGWRWTLGAVFWVPFLLYQLFKLGAAIVQQIHSLYLSL